MFDFSLEDPSKAVSTLTMVLELATVLLGAFVGVVAVLYAAPKGYLGHRRRKGSIASEMSRESSATPTEQAEGVPAAVATTVAEPAPSPVEAIYETVQPTPAPVQAIYETVQPTPAPVQAIYETVQPTPAPVQYTAPSVTSFGAPSISKKPTRTYRRRTAPVRSTAASKASLKAKTKKR
jgi:hypothetical protein